MGIVNEIHLKSWEEFVALYGDYRSKSSPYIFRGQSNSILNGKFSKWSLKSSFNRMYSEPNCYRFATVLDQHLDDDLFNYYYSKYAYNKIDFLNGLNKLQKAYFLQHYGVPTCFVDFTYNPLIALYFAISSIPGSSGQTYNAEYEPVDYSVLPDMDYMSIYRINYEVLNELYEYRNIGTDDFDPSLESYYVYLNKYTSASFILSLDLEPANKLGELCFHNLKKQESCFLLFDSHKLGNKGFIELIDYYLRVNQYQNIIFNKEVVTIYNIPYNSIVPPREMNINKPTVFKYLNSKQLTGKYLFDDIQGLKYDFNYFHR